MKFLRFFLVLGANQLVPSLAIGLRNDPTPSTSTSAPPPERPPCPKDCKQQILLPDTDCCKYWQCDEGKGVLRTCPSGLNWNPSKNICDWQANAGCDGNGWCNFVPIVCPTTPKPTITPKPTKDPNAPPCPADCPHPLFVPDRDCCKYWQCNCGTGTLLSCPSGLNWNPVLDTCDWPGSARCTGQGWRKADLKCPKNSSSDEDDSSNNSSQEENSSNNSSQEKNSSNNSSQEKNSSNNSSQENSSNNSSQENDSSNEDKSSNENN